MFPDVCHCLCLLVVFVCFDFGGLVEVFFFFSVLFLFTLFWPSVSAFLAFSPFVKFVLPGAVTHFKDGFSCGQQWINCRTSSVQHRVAQSSCRDHSDRPPLPPKLATLVKYVQSIWTCFSSPTLIDSLKVVHGSLRAFSLLTKNGSSHSSFTPTLGNCYFSLINCMNTYLYWSSSKMPDVETSDSSSANTNSKWRNLNHANPRWNIYRDQYHTDWKYKWVNHLNLTT